MSNPTIHINPKFRTVHINPNFLPKNVQPSNQHQSASAVPPTNIFVNPNFLHPSVQHSLPHSVTTAFTTAQSHQPIAATAPKYAQSKIISQTNRKLVRQPIVSQEPPKVTAMTNPQASNSSPLLRIGMRKLVRRGTNITTTKSTAIRQNAVLKAKHVSDQHASSKYRVRNIGTSTVSPMNRYKFDRRLVAGPNRSSSHASSVVLSKHQLLSIGHTNMRYPKESPTKSAHRKLAYLNINGVFYKSTKNKLQRHDQANISAAAATRPAVSSHPNNGSVLSIIVRGVKYSMSADSKRLQRDRSHNSVVPSGSVQPSATSNGARLDIGGMTYVQVTPDTFERTDGHRTRGHLTAARQRSIHLLLAAGNRTKSNVPCVIYQRLGKCRALERGRCPRVHDAKRVAICPKFLLGSCQLSPCLLSHAVTLSKMPTCKFFLAGICVRDDCPYLHKKLGAKATICPDFLRGFCERAEECDKRHEFLCPDHTATGTCDKIRCPYPHPSAEKRQKKISNPEPISEMDVAAGSSDVEYVGRSLEGVLDKVRKVKARYTKFDPATLVDDANRDDQPSGDQSQLNTSDDVLVLIPSRPKLGALPSYIPF